MEKQAREHKKGQIFYCDPNELTIIGLDHGDENHPLYDARVKDPIDSRLVQAMLSLGWFGAVTVRREGDRDVVVAGRSRVRAAREANKILKSQKKDPLMIGYAVSGKSRTDDSATVGLMIAENELRTEDLPPNRARKCARYLALGNSEDQAATVFGVSRQTVKNWMAVLKGPDDVITAVDKGKINMTAAYELVKVKDPAERHELIQEAAENGSSGAKTRSKIQRDRAVKQSNGSSADDLPHEPPGKRILRKLYEQDGSDLDPDVRNTIGWVLGYVGANRIRGLKAACRDVGEIVSED